jgi:hypothetical protein
LSRGSSPCGYPHEPLVSYQINRQLSGWILPPLVIRAFGAHCHEPTHAPQQISITSFEHDVGALQKCFRNREAYGFRSFEIDRQLELRWLLYG